jgi:hypothetical protein
MKTFEQQRDDEKKWERQAERFWAIVVMVVFGAYLLYKLYGLL